MHAMASFNPCFGGRGAGTRVSSPRPAFQASFNPCFGGRGAGTEYRHDAERVVYLVSILVLVEGALEPRERGNADEYYFRVSILVLVEGALERGRRWYVLSFPSVFQSLFWWKGRWNPPASLSPQRQKGCFNPCFGGRGAGTLITAFPSWDRTCFNPCFGGRGAGTSRYS